nr:HpcH/HpaI aldolase/citrate lyase family protein [Sphingomonas sp. CDS-1]
MPAPFNSFKAAITAGQRQIGLWLALANSYSAEIAANAGFDWLVVDAEHAPNDVPILLMQLQALAPYPAAAVVRLPADETWMIKQVLDIGAQTILVPMVESAVQAQQIVAATRYAPAGVRGIGAALARASNFNAIPDYIATANAQICVLVQVETRVGLAAIEDLCAVDGVDGIFVGPSDLAADMGYPGNSAHPEVQEQVFAAIARIVAGGKACGILTSSFDQAKDYLAAGCSFVAVGTDVGVLVNGLKVLRQRFEV